MKGITKILFLNKVDIFTKKISTEKGKSDFLWAFPEFRGEFENLSEVSDHVAKSFCDSLTTDDFVHHHTICALDSNAMPIVFRAVCDDIFARNFDEAQKNLI